MIVQRGSALMSWAIAEGGALSLKAAASGNPIGKRALAVGAFPSDGTSLIWSEPLDEWSNFTVGVSIEKTAHTATFPVTTGSGYAKMEAWTITHDEEIPLLRVAANFGTGVSQPFIIAGNSGQHHDMTLPANLLSTGGVGAGYKASHPFIICGGIANTGPHLPMPFYRIGYVISIDPDAVAAGTETFRFTINEFYSGRVKN